MTIGYGATFDFPLSSYDEIESYSIFDDDVSLYSVPASHRTIFSPSHNIGLESLYNYSLGYPLGSILLGLDAIKRETIFYDLESNDILIFDQNVHIARDIDASLLEQTLVFIEDNHLNKVSNLLFEQQLEFTEVAKHVVIAPPINQELEFSQDVVINVFKIINVQDQLELFDISILAILFYRESVDQLNFNQQVLINRAISLQFNDFLEFADLAKNIRIIDVQQQLEFTEDLLLQKHIELNFFQSLLFNETLTINVVRNLVSTQKLNFINAKRFIPIAGKLIDLPIVDIYVSNKETNYLILESTNKMIVLPTPEWGDTDKPDNEVEVRRSMNNTVYSFIKRSILRTFRYEFEIGRLKALEYLDFINDNLGEKIYLRDWKNNLYYGNIVKNPIDANMVSRFDNEIEKVVISFDFVGVRI